MEAEHQITFGPFRLEVTQGRLWRDDQMIPLRPRSLAMLGYLAAHPGRLVTKAEVHRHVSRRLTTPEKRAVVPPRLQIISARPNTSPPASRRKRPCTVCQSLLPGAPAYAPPSPGGRGLPRRLW